MKRNRRPVLRQFSHSMLKFEIKAVRLDFFFIISAGKWCKRQWTWFKYFIWNRWHSTMVFEYSDGISSETSKNIIENRFDQLASISIPKSEFFQFSALFNDDWCHCIDSIHSNTGFVHGKYGSSSWINHFNNDFCYWYCNIYTSDLGMPFANCSSS